MNFGKLVIITVAAVIVVAALLGASAYLGLLQNPKIEPTSPSGVPAASNNPSIGSGAMLYATYCSSCHGDLAASSKVGRTTVQIQNALNNVAAMKSLSGLTEAQIRDIATALGSSK